jgi:phosphatidylserine/phosphatidylglycerophosphate/cardiolipin synthase-like enzyme
VLDYRDEWQTLRQPGGFPDPAQGQTGVLRQAKEVMVHTKLTIIDDAWAMIGSANCTRRSLFTDFEHNVAFIDPQGTTVRDLRCRLWAEVFRATDPTLFQNLDRALNGWNDAWGTPGGVPFPTRGPAPVAPNYLEPVDLVHLASIELLPAEQKRYDARKAWGFCLKPGPDDGF